jgi:hypothetical protein
MAAAAMAVAYVTSTMRLERHSSTKHQRGEAEGASRHHLCAVAMRLIFLSPSALTRLRSCVARSVQDLRSASSTACLKRSPGCSTVAGEPAHRPQRALTTCPLTARIHHALLCADRAPRPVNCVALAAAARDQAWQLSVAILYEAYLWRERRRARRRPPRDAPCELVVPCPSTV